MTGDRSWGQGPATGRAAVRELAPDASGCLDRLASATPVPPARLALVRATCAAVHGLEPLAAADDPGDTAPGDDAVRAFATAFGTDVTTIDDALRGRFLDATGDAAFPTVQAIWIADMVPRARAALDALAGASDGWPVPPDAAADDGVEVDDAWGLIDELLVTVHRLDALDPVTTEVVRLRGARQHRCRLCQSLRSRPALAAGGDDALWAALDVPSSLPSPVHRAALGLVDAMIWTPARLPAVLVTDVRSVLTPAQSVEVVLDVVRNAANKIAVALAADEAHVADGVEVYEIDDRGIAHYGLDAPDVIGGVDAG